MSILNEDVINKIYYYYISLSMTKSFNEIHRELKWHKIHKELKNNNYLNLTDFIFQFEIDFIFIIRIPLLRPVIL
jgi:hypothetical protein